MINYKPLPIGVDDFAKLRRLGYYYVDKTPMLEEIIRTKGDVNLCTRPRRFGKSLNLSMIRSFFEIPMDGENPEALFEGLKIMEADEAILKEQGRYPVIQLSLKAGKQRTFEQAISGLCKEIAYEFRRHQRRMDISRLEDYEERFRKIAWDKGTVEDYKDSLKFLSEYLFDYYHEPTIILIDEYDVPLENAFFEGFYDEMIGFIRSLFESALKTNPNLNFAVITGCLRISRESIFTGLNNLKINSILSEDYDEYFGFTPAEVETMLEYYGLEAKKALTKEWYDGYIFGDAEVYNPWSVLNFVSALYVNPDTLPVPYWSNTSSNSIVKKLIEQAGIETRQELEALIEGERVEKPVYEEITYGDVDKTEDNLWNFLFFTGYLKMTETRMGPRNTRYVTLEIPNEEIRYIYMNAIMDWFDQRVRTRDFSALYTALLSGDTTTMEECIADELLTSISYYDNSEAVACSQSPSGFLDKPCMAAIDQIKDLDSTASFYHGFMRGIFRNMKDYIVLSNQESGKGRPDMIIKYPSVRGLAIIIEFKVTREFEALESVCDAALAQIEEMDYEAGLYKEGYRKFMRYGIGFYKKECMVKKQCI